MTGLPFIAWERLRNWVKNWKVALSSRFTKEFLVGHQAHRLSGKTEQGRARQGKQ